MHFLHIVQLYAPAPSGAARYFQELGRRLVAEGHRVTVVATDAFDLEHLWLGGKRRVEAREDTFDGVRVLRLPVWRAPGPALLYPALRRGMAELARLPGSAPLLRRLATLTPRLPALQRLLASPELADVALVHTTNITLDFAILPLARWAARRGVPHICTPFVHLGEPGSRQIVQYYTMPHQVELLRRSAAVITMTDLERGFLRAKGVPDALMHTVGVGVSPAEVAGGDGERFRREHGIAGPIVLTIDTAAYDKGTVHVVEAMRRLWAAGVEATWVQCGALMGHFEQFYAALPPEDKARTRLLGFVPQRTLHDAFAAADVYAMPSRTDSFGIAYLEAWCYGVPVVGANAGGVPDVISHNEDGLLAPFGDVGAIASAIGRLLRERPLAEAMGASGRAKVLHELTWEHKYALARAVYDEVLGHTSGRARGSGQGGVGAARPM
jgi:glycosyltransferase involved in cell wall biosynthesis